MRLFIAIEIPEEIKVYIDGILSNIDNKTNKIRPVNKNNIHLTLKFLGEIQLNQLELIKEYLHKITFENFSINLDKIGVFPSEKYIKVIWVGLKPEQLIIKLQNDIDEALKKLFDRENKFASHLTLARVKYIENKKQFINELNGLKIENKKIEINNFRLIKSTLTGKGPIYEVVEVFG